MKKSSALLEIALSVFLLVSLMVVASRDDFHIPNHRHFPAKDYNILPDITAAIGNTPLVDLSRISRHYGINPNHGRILAKLEYLNPGSSKKDRIALQIIREARKNGSLQNGQPVVELTSGNTGTGLAMVCSVLGHPFVAVMSKGNSEERAVQMKALGAKVVLVDQCRDSQPGKVTGADLDKVESMAQKLSRDLQAFRADQFIRDANKQAHFLGTGPELWKESGFSITDFVDFVGTGGSFGGIAEYLKQESHGRIRCYIVEPQFASILKDEDDDSNPQKERYTSHKIQGGGYLKSKDDLPMIRKSQDNQLIDGYISVSDEEAIQAARDLARYEGIFGGFSGGANFIAAVKLLRNRLTHRSKGITNNLESNQEKETFPGEKKAAHPPVTVAILICDSGLKYMSTDLWH